MAEPAQHTPSEVEPALPELDPVQAEFLQRRLQDEQNLAAALFAGALASGAGALAWAGATVLTGYQVGLLALGIGFLVGYAVRVAGRGITLPFGLVGGGLSLVGCGVGNVLAVTALLALEDGTPVLDAVSRLTPEIAGQLMVLSFSPIDIVFYGLAVYEGYRLSFRELAPEELQRMLPGVHPQ